jgi:Arc/MetJ-type ribon-helix-helix transcriptional regulator
MMVQVNVKLDDRLVEEVEALVENGHVRTKKEAIERGLGLLIRSYKASEIENRIDKVRQDTEKMPSVTRALVKSHEEEP